MVRLLVGAILALAGWAQWQAGAPRIGCVLDPNGGLRPLWGIAGNFVAGERLAEGVISAACRDGRAVVKLDGELLLVDERGVVSGRWQAPPGPALFAHDAAGRPALVYFPEEGLLCRLRGEGLEPLRSFEDEVAAIAWLGQDKALRAVRRHGGIELVEFAPHDPASDVPVQTLPWDGPVLALEGGRLLLGDRSQLLLRQADGSFRSYPMPALVTGLRTLGDGWVEVELAARPQRIAVRIAGEEVALFALPEVVP